MDKVKFDQWSDDETLQQARISQLELTPQRVEELKSLECKIYNGPEPTDKNSKTNVEKINLSNLVGSARPSHPGPNWYECLKDCHKMKNFNPEYTLQSYKELLLNPPSNDVPTVIKYKDEYYISLGGGKHRLTIGKCIGAVQAKVMVSEIV